ncbi:ABC transporter ATP-binding protein [Gordonia jinhuaensis]|uniref:ABC transporter ATP-binding protein n=1 Tax=Gordonia jinhuaensis TaxID=1517702 RepID=A0A916WU52_9ACTN|nr:ABC transporter ATP-binding protein [Gordonia jinhuaensis]GGB30044.1 ABC transporter ATP-binding protein [Gordonia jinhuaensis]
MKQHRPRRILWSLLKPYIRQLAWPLIALIIIQIAATTLSLYTPFLTARLVDEGIAKADVSRIEHLGVIMLVLAAISLVLSVAATILGSRISTTVSRGLRREVYRRVGTFSALDFDRFGTGSLITRTTNDVNQVEQVVFIVTTVLVTAPIMVVGGTVLAIRVSAEPAPIIVVTAVLLAIVVVVIVRRMIPQYAIIQKTIDALNRVLREQLSGTRIIRAFGREHTALARFGEQNDTLARTSYRVGMLQVLLMTAIPLISNAAAIAVLGVGAVLVDHGHMQVGQVIAYITYLSQILAGVSVATLLISVLPRARISAERIREVLATVPSIRTRRDPISPQHDDGIVRFLRTSLAYPDAQEPVLTDVSFSCLPGSVTGILGGTGSGKTTLLALAARMIDPTDGAVHVNGLDLRAQNRSEVWTQMGVVAQRPGLLGGTIASNLRLGNPDASDAQLWEALDIACATDFVAADPAGLDRAVAPGGKNLSGGQRQRIALARALIRRPNIYLLDDPFSALDPGTERRVKNNIAAALPNATVIIATQRLSSVADADTIVVLGGGRIVGAGDADELADTCQEFRELALSQSRSR